MSKFGGLLFLLGAVITLFTFGEWLLTGDAPGVWAYYLAALMPLGFGLIGIDFYLMIRRRAQGSTNASE